MRITQTGKARCLAPEFADSLTEIGRKACDSARTERDLLDVVYTYIAMTLCSDEKGFTEADDTDLAAFLNSNLVMVKAVLHHHAERLGVGCEVAVQ